MITRERSNQLAQFAMRVVVGAPDAGKIMVDMLTNATPEEYKVYVEYFNQSEKFMDGMKEETAKEEGYVRGVNTLAAMRKFRNGLKGE